MNLDVAVFVLFTCLLYGSASAKLYLSHENEVKQEDDTLTLLCHDNDNGLPLSWKGPKNHRFGEKTTPRTRTASFGTLLIFDKLQRKDTGTYTCMTASGETAVFTLTVEEKTETSQPEIITKNTYKLNKKITTTTELPQETTVTQDAPRLPQNTPEKHLIKEEIVYGYINGTVNITCEVDAEPPPTFKWFRRTNKANVGEEITVSPYKSVLRLKLTEEDIDDYKCQARNKYGQVDVIFKILNSSRPNAPTILNLTEETSDTLTLEIDNPELNEDETESHMIPIGYLVEYRLASDSESKWMAKKFAKSEDNTYSLTQLAHTTQYEVRAAMENRVGLSDFTNSLIFETEPNAANMANFNVASFIFVIFLIVLNGLFGSHI